MKSIRDILISAFALMLIAGLVTAALAGTNALTKGVIADRTAAAEDAARSEVIAGDVEFVRATLTDNSGEVVYYVAQDKATKKAVGYVFTARSVGKSSGLVVMTGIGADGAVQGVKITEDNETAGYVDKVTKGGLLDAFKGLSSQNAVDGVDAVSQATKTSNGVKNAVSQAMQWYTLAVKGGEAVE